jgi:iron complex outermembrane receptor protein
MRYMSVKVALLGGAAIAAASVCGPAYAQAPNDDAPAANENEIVVTARLRNESLMDVPVAVNALSSEKLDEYKVADLTDIGSLVPNVIVGDYKINGGGSLSIRGISSPATQIGFEQPVSVSIDGVQTSAGRVAMLGFFDLDRVEVLRGPQTLFFGKNSPAGVISVVSAGPTKNFEAGGSLGYEFAGREMTGEGYVSGPIGSGFGARLAVRYRDLDGWLKNNAGPLANPYYGSDLPAGVAILPGRQSKRIGERELMGRLTLEYDDGGPFTATAKLFAIRNKGMGAGAFAQNIGPCPADGLPRSYGVADPYGDCRADDQTSYGDIPDEVAQTMPRGGDSGRGRDKMTALIGSLNLGYDFGGVTLTSITGYVKHKYFYLSALDQTIYGGLTVLEDNKLESISQEVRLSSDFDGPINFLVGAYYQDSKDDLYNDALITPYTFFRLAGTGRYEAYEKVGSLNSKTYSVFGQLIWDVTDTLELAGGLRYTDESRDTRNQNLYGFGPFATQTTVFPGSTDPTPGMLAGSFSDANLSPEVTLTFRPTNQLTAWAAFKTGFKSGGFALTSPIQRTATLNDIDFDSETVRGGEGGIRGDFGALTFNATAFLYDFKDLQATVYNPVDVRFSINNAGKLKQRGFEFDAGYKAAPGLEFHAAFAYVHNRYKDYVGQCYSFTYAAGTNPATAAPPPGCEFVSPGESLVLEQDFEGRRPARSPDFTGSFGSSYEMDISSNLMLRFSGDAYYSSTYNASDAAAPGAVQPSFWRFNAGARIGAPDKRWELALIGKNLGNKHYLLFATDRTGGSTLAGFGEQRGAVARGREVSLQASFRF